MHDLSAFANRLRKQLKLRRKWAGRAQTEAYRLYEEDIPEFPFIVDVYAGDVVIYDKRRALQDGEQDDLDESAFLKACAEALDTPEDRIHLKLRRRMPGAQQYERLATTDEYKTVREEQSVYLVNLHDYLDTGLFLDHRPLRSQFRQAGVKNSRCLNLFCYTGSVSVAAAQGGYRCTSVDMSNTYLDWAKRNFVANSLDPKKHEFLRADVLRFLEAGPRQRESYELIFLDPPTFSNSKKMLGSFDVQRDHRHMLELALGFLAPGGRLYFSTNRQRFHLDERLRDHARITDVTAATIPDDFRNEKIHRCYLFEDL